MSDYDALVTRLHEEQHWHEEQARLQGGEATVVGRLHKDSSATCRDARDALASLEEENRRLHEWAEDASGFIANLVPRNGYESNRQAGLGTWYAALASPPVQEREEEGT